MADKKDKTEEILNFTLSNKGFYARPRISKLNLTKSKEEHVPFLAADLKRVQDFSDINPPLPPDSLLLYGDCSNQEKSNAGAGPEIDFIPLHFALRAKFIFVFAEEDVTYDDSTTPSTCYYENGAPKYVIPLHRCDIEIPRGGRRVFQEHAFLSSTTRGYEFMVRHKVRKARAGASVGGEQLRQPVYLIAQTLAQRDEWVSAMRVRAEIGRSTQLLSMEEAMAKEESKQENISSPNSPTKRVKKTNKTFKARSRFFKKGSKTDDVLKVAVDEFGNANFSPEDYVLDIFKNYTGTDPNNAAIEKSKDLIHMQNVIKDGLKMSVLEQYKYFVDASREINEMGKDVAKLHQLVEEQLERINAMKGIHFTGFIDLFEEDLAENDHNAHHEVDTDNDTDITSPTTAATVTEIMSVTSHTTNTTIASSESQSSNKQQIRHTHRHASTNTVEIPLFILESVDEIAAYVNECRYSDATDLTIKVHAELKQLLKKADVLNSSQLMDLKRIDKSVKSLGSLIADRLTERLRRLNDSIKQERKRERADPLSEYTPLLSPICLYDDIIPLKLLIKLGRTEKAVEQYAARRSLLLGEILLERQVSSSSSVDVEIQAMRISKSFFRAMSDSVKGFVDLFNAANNNNNKGSKGTSLGAKLENVPPGAFSYLIMWCDVEIEKFAYTFGGPTILGQLPLTPPTDNKKSSQITTSGASNDIISEQKKQMNIAEQRGNYAAAAALRRKIAMTEEAAFQQQNRQAARRTNAQVSGNNKTTSVDSRSPMSKEKDRQLAISIASKCIEHAFEYSSQSLTGIGLPILPRIAESIKSDLRGCEVEIASILKTKWGAVVLDWFG